MKILCRQCVNLRCSRRSHFRRSCLFLDDPVQRPAQPLLWSIEPQQARLPALQIANWLTVQILDMGTESLMNDLFQWVRWQLLLNNGPETRHKCRKMYRVHSLQCIPPIVRLIVTDSVPLLTLIRLLFLIWEILRGRLLSRRLAVLRWSSCFSQYLQ